MFANSARFDNRLVVNMRVYLSRLDFSTQGWMFFNVPKIVIRNLRRLRQRVVSEPGFVVDSSSSVSGPYNPQSP